MKNHSRPIKLIHFLYKADIKPGYFIIAAFFSLLAAFSEGISAGLLIPLVKGIISMDFNLIRDLPVLKLIFKKLPVFISSTNASLFVFLVGVVFFAAVISYMLQYVSSLVVSFQVRYIGHRLRTIIFSRYLSLGKMFFDRNNAGHLHNVLINFTSMIMQALSGAELFLSSLFMFFAYIVIMITISWKLTLFAVAVFPVLYHALKYVLAKLNISSEHYVDSYKELSSRISNILSCISLVKLYQYGESENRRFDSISRNVQAVEFSLDKKRNLIKPIQEIILLLAVLFVAAAMSIMLLKDKSVSVASFLVFFYLLKKAQVNFNLCNNFRAQLAQVSGPIFSVVKILDDDEKFIIPEGKMDFPGLKEVIEFKSLSFSYMHNAPILHNVSLCIKKGKTTAIVGPTGGGKTTIISLLLRLYDCPPGSIFIDNTDIRNFTLKSLLTHMALVSQDTLLFNDTLRSNITYGLEGVKDEELSDILKKARLYDFVMTLPQGLDTYIGDRGVKLSGGEKQRVAIARALLKGSEILILDEATSSLDTNTEKLIQEAIDEAVKDRTAIVIAHRLSTIKKADKIVVIENGRVVEEGSLDELINKNGKFYGYWQAQKF